MSTNKAVVIVRFKDSGEKGIREILDFEFFKKWHKDCELSKEEIVNLLYRMSQINPQDKIDSTLSESYMETNENIFKVMNHRQRSLNRDSWSMLVFGKDARYEWDIYHFSESDRKFIKDALDNGWITDLLKGVEMVVHYS